MTAIELTLPAPSARRLVGRRLAPVPARAPDVLAQPERRVLRRLLPLLLLAIFGAVFAGDQKDLDVIVPGSPA